VEDICAKIDHLLAGKRLAWIKRSTRAAIPRLDMLIALESCSSKAGNSFLLSREFEFHPVVVAAASSEFRSSGSADIARRFFDRREHFSFFFVRTPGLAIRS